MSVEDKETPPKVEVTPPEAAKVATTTVQPTAEMTNEGVTVR